MSTVYNEQYNKQYDLRTWLCKRGLFETVCFNLNYIDREEWFILDDQYLVYAHRNDYINPDHAKQMWP